MKEITVQENGMYIHWRIEENKDLKFLHFSSMPLQQDDIVDEAVSEGFPFIGMNLSGFDRPYERHGNKYIVTAPGYRMKYVGHRDERNEQGRLIQMDTEDEETKVHVSSFWQFYDDLSVVRIWHRVENRGKEAQGLEYISNFHYKGIEKESSREMKK